VKNRLVLLNILLNLTKDEINNLKKDKRFNFEEIIPNLFKLITNPLALYSIFNTDVFFEVIYFIFRKIQ
jgi:hypothetical protein